MESDDDKDGFFETITIFYEDSMDVFDILKKSKDGRIEQISEPELQAIRQEIKARERMLAEMLKEPPPCEAEKQE